MSDIRFVGDMQRLQIKEGDRFILTIDQPISSETADKIQEVWSTFTEGKGGKLLLLERGMKLGVISQIPEKG